MSEGISYKYNDITNFNWNRKPRKNRYCYLVYCNPENPLVYAVYTNKTKAVIYARNLIKWRFENANNKKYDFGYYHYVTEEKKKETDFDKREKLIFSVCLQIKDNLKQFSDDGCLIKVIRRPLLTK
jgi:hypothetical protein